MSDSASPRPPSSAGVAPSTPPVHTMSFADTGVSRWNSECAELAKNSYKCIADNNGKKEPCVDHFNKYKECRKNEHTTIIENRRKGLSS